MAVSLDYSAWLLEDGEIKRRFDYQDPKTKAHIATLFFDCKVEKGLVEPLTFMRFVFRPFRVVDDLDLGLSLAPLEGGRPMPVGVRVTSVDDGEGCLMSPRTPQGNRLVLSHLLAGYQLKFGIWQGPEQLVDMPLYNDSEFAQLHRDAVRRTATTPAEKEVVLAALKPPICRNDEDDEEARGTDANDSFSADIATQNFDLKLRRMIQDTSPH